MAEQPATAVAESENGAGKTRRSRPTRNLPTDRIAFPKQLDLLRAYAAASGPNTKVVTNNEVAEIVQLTASTVSLANSFFADARLLVRTEGGYLPSADVLAFHRAYEWNPENASHKLAPAISSTWFAQALLPKLNFRAVEENEALEELATVAAAGPEYRTQLRTCLEYLVAAGLAQRDGSMLKATRAAATTPQPSADGATPAPPTAEPREKGRPLVSSTFTQPTEGVVQFNVSVRVDMKEFSSWPADRIAAFFGGVAQVLAAKAGVEQDAGS